MGKGIGHMNARSEKGAARETTVKWSSSDCCLEGECGDLNRCLIGVKTEIT